MFDHGLLAICGTEGSEDLMQSVVAQLNKHIMRRRDVIRQRVENTNHTLSELWESRLMGTDVTLNTGEKPLRIEYLQELEYIAELSDIETRKRSQEKFISPLKLEKINFKSSEFKYVLRETGKGKDVYIIMASNEQSCLYPMSQMMFENIIHTFYGDELLKKLSGKDDEKRKKVIFEHIPHIVDFFHSFCIAERTVPYNVIQALIVIDTMHRAKARRITLVGMLPFGRQDEAAERESVTFPLLLHVFKMAGVNSFITFDQHCPKNISSNMHFESLPAFPIMLEQMRKDFPDMFTEKEKLKYASVDAGGSKRVEKYAKKNGYKMAIAHKTREQVNEVSRVRIIGKIDGVNLLFIDDMIDTGGSLERACETAKSAGAKDITVAVTYGLFSSPALERLQGLYDRGIIKAVYTTNLIPRSLEFKKKYPWYKEVSISDALALAIYRTNTGRSIEKLFDDKVKTLLG